MLLAVACGVRCLDDLLHMHIAAMPLPTLIATRAQYDFQARPACTLPSGSRRLFFRAHAKLTMSGCISTRPRFTTSSTGKLAAGQHVIHANM